MSLFERRVAEALRNPVSAAAYHEAGREVWRMKVFGSRFAESWRVVSEWLCAHDLHHWTPVYRLVVTSNSAILTPTNQAVNDYVCRRGCGAEMTRP
jgi:hypothetical protein